MNERRILEPLCYRDIAFENLRSLAGGLAVYPNREPCEGMAGQLPRRNSVPQRSGWNYEAGDDGAKASDKGVCGG